MKKYMKYPTTHQGFTLLEVILSVLIVGILFSGIGILMPSLTGTYRTTIDRSYAKHISNNIATAIRDELLFATLVDVQPDAVTYLTPTGLHTIQTTADGKQVEGLEFPEEYFMRKAIALHFEQIGRAHV